MILTSEIFDLLPSSRMGKPSYSWSIYEVGPGPRHDLLAVGTFENNDPHRRELDVRVVDLRCSDSYSRVVMEGRGAYSLGGVKITPGHVLVHSASMQGRGIGTLVFNIVTAWAQRTFPGQEVVPITIIRPAGSAEFDRLARFYGRFGIRFDRPEDGNWNQEFPSLPVNVEDLSQYPEGELLHVRRIELPEALTLMLDRLSQASDDRRLLAVMRKRQTGLLAKWSMIGRWVSKTGLVIAFILGICIAKIYGAIT